MIRGRVFFPLRRGVSGKGGCPRAPVPPGICSAACTLGPSVPLASRMQRVMPETPMRKRVLDAPPGRLIERANIRR